MTDEPQGDLPSDPDRPMVPEQEALPFERGQPEQVPEPELIGQAPTTAAPAPYPPAEPKPAKRSVLMPLLGLVGFVILAAAIGYLWVRPNLSSASAGPSSNDSGVVTALQSDVATLKTQLAALDKRESSDVAALHAAIAALPVPSASAPAGAATASGTPASAPGAPSSAMAANGTSAPATGAAPSATGSSGTPASATSAPSGAMAASGTSAPATGAAPATTSSSGTPASATSAAPVATVSNGTPTPAATGSSASPQTATPPPSAPPSVAQAASDAALVQMVASLSDRLNQLQSAEANQAQQTQSLPSAADVSHLATRVDTVSEKASRDDSAIRQDLSLVQQQLTLLSGQAQTLSKNAAALPQLTAQSDRLGQIVRAQDALRDGLPLGTIENAPTALSRFADTAPPTEAALRLSFEDASKAADKAGEPTPDQGHFWHRVWVRAQALVMVRQGDHVVLGDPTSAILAHAETVLDAGDLSGTLAVLDTLSGPAAGAMAPWEAQARALVQAREALTQMAAG